MKKLLMVAYHYPPEGGSSGVLRTLKFSKYLPCYGWIPHILTLKEWAYGAKDFELLKDIPKEVVVHRTIGLNNARHLSIKGCHLGFLSIPDPFVSWLPFGIVQGINVISSNTFDALYSTSPPPTAHLIAASIKTLTNLPWVADFRDPWIEEGINPRPGSLRYRIESILEKFVVQKADRLIVTTPQLKREFLSRYSKLRSLRVKIIYNGYDESDFDGLDGVVQKDRFEIMHAGLMNKEFRDPFPVLEAVSSLIAEGSMAIEVTRVTFLGDSGYANSYDFRYKIKQLRLEKVVKIADRVSHREALRRLQQCAVLLLLQASNDTRSLIPAKAFEYLRLGRPILALTLNGATTDLLKNIDQCYVTDPRDKISIKSNILTLYKRWQCSNDELSMSPQVLQYERRKLTRHLAKLLTKLNNDENRVWK